MVGGWALNARTVATVSKDGYANRRAGATVVKADATSPLAIWRADRRRCGRSDPGMALVSGRFLSHLIRSEFHAAGVPVSMSPAIRQRADASTRIVGVE